MSNHEGHEGHEGHEEHEDGEPTVDPTFRIADYLHAEAVVDSLIKDLEIQFQLEGLGFDRATMRKHVMKRKVLIITKGLLLDQCERLLTEARK